VKLNPRSAATLLLAPSRRRACSPRADIPGIAFQQLLIGVPAHLKWPAAYAITPCKINRAFVMLKAATKRSGQLLLHWLKNDFCCDA
jgi:hypothetical protein